MYNIVMKRKPEFVVSSENTQASVAKGYARAFNPSGNRWITTKYKDNAFVFYTYSAALDAYNNTVKNCSNNRFWVIKLERIDLCESILQDIDDLHKL